jgi:hypothetical protein
MLNASAHSKRVLVRAALFGACGLALVACRGGEEAAPTPRGPQQLVEWTEPFVNPGPRAIKGSDPFYIFQQIDGSFPPKDQFDTHDQYAARFDAYKAQGVFGSISSSKKYVLVSQQQWQYDAEKKQITIHAPTEFNRTDRKDTYMSSNAFGARATVDRTEQTTVRIEYYYGDEGPCNCLDPGVSFDNSATIKYGPSIDLFRQIYMTRSSIPNGCSLPKRSYYRDYFMPSRDPSGSVSIMMDPNTARALPASLEIVSVVSFKPNNITEKSICLTNTGEWHTQPTIQNPLEILTHTWNLNAKLHRVIARVPETGQVIADVNMDTSPPAANLGSIGDPDVEPAHP